MKTKKMIALLLSVLMVFIFAGCSSGQGSSESADTQESNAVSAENESSSESFTITDVMDREVTFDSQPETFIVANYIFNFLLVGGSDSLDQVVGMTKDGWEDTRYGEYTVLTEAFPVINDIESIGGYHDDVLNTELILELAPDCLLISQSQYTENETSISVWEDAGIHVVVLDYHQMIMENHLNSTEILGRLLGREEIAQELCDTYQNGIEMVQERIATLPDEEKGATVYMELGNMGVGEIGNSYDGMLWGAILDNIGATNIAKGILEDGYGPLDMEYILEQDPEIIIIGGSIWSGDNNGDQMRMGFTIDEDLAQERLAGFADRPLWSNMQAVVNNQIYGVDHGSLRNILDYSFTEYLAKIVYPDLFEDIDPAAEYEEMLNQYLPEIAGSGTFMIHLER